MFGNGSYESSYHRNAFVDIRISSHTIEFNHPDRFQIVRDYNFFHYRNQSERYSAKWDRGFKALSDDTIFAHDCLRFESEGVGRNLTQLCAIG